MEKEKIIFSWIMYSSTSRLEKYLSEGVSPNITIESGLNQIGLFEFFIDNLSDIKNKEFIEDTLKIFRKYAVPMLLKNNISLFNNIIKNDFIDLTLFEELKYLYDENCKNNILSQLLKNDGFIRKDYNLELQIQKVKECGINLFEKNETGDNLTILSEKSNYIKLSLNDIKILEKYDLQINTHFLQNIILYNYKCHDKKELIAYLMEKIPFIDTYADAIGESLLGQYADSIYKKDLWDVFFEKTKPYGILNSHGFLSKIINLKEETIQESEFKNYIFMQNNLSFDEYLKEYISNCFSRITNAYVINQWEMDKFDEVYKEKIPKYIKQFQTVLNILDKKNPSFLYELDIKSILEENIQVNKSVPIDYLLGLKDMLNNVYERKKLNTIISNHTTQNAVKKTMINRI